MTQKKEVNQRAKQALNNHAKGYNCCQSVACAFSDMVNVNEETLFKACEGFGLGMGSTECTCGAISGAIMIAGFKNSSGDTSNTTTKGSTYKISKEIVNRFVQKNGSMLCKDLKGIQTGTPLRSCNGCIEDVTLIAQELLSE